MDQSLLVFISVADHQNFTRAAEALHMTQPAVSNHIQTLEKSMGVKLLDRTNKYVRLNKAGEVVYHHAKQILNLYTRMENLIDDLKNTASGSISIGSSYTFGEYILPHVIARLHKDFPLIRPSITIENSTEVMSGLLHHQLDIGIIEAEESHFRTERLIPVPFMIDKMSLVVSSQHPLTKKHKIEREDLQKEMWICREEGSGTRELQEAAFKRLRFIPDNLMAFGSTQVIKESLEAGLGISLLSETTMRKELKLGTLQILNFKGFPITRHFSFVTPDLEFQTKAIDVLIQLLHSFKESDIEHL